MTEDATPGGVVAVASERGQIEQLIGDSGSAYWKGPDAPVLQARYREIIGADDGSAKAPAMKGSDAEIAALEADMRRDIDLWRRSPAKQARLMALYEAREGGTADYDGGPADDAERHAAMMYDVPQLSSGLQTADFEEIVSAPWAHTLAAQWGDRFPQQMAAAQMAAVEILSTMPADYQAEMVDIFDGLPVRTQAQILKRLAGGK